MYLGEKNHLWPTLLTMFNFFCPLLSVPSPTVCTECTASSRIHYQISTLELLGLCCKAAENTASVAASHISVYGGHIREN